jgi:hemerythrin-like domain-containing protein
MSTSPLTLHAAPASGFDEPFEMLLACHQRVERMLVLMARLDQHLAEHGNDAQAQQAAQDVMRYFDLAGPAHHEDEERHLFPALLAHGMAASVALVQRLQAEHLAMAQQWQAVRADLGDVTAGTWQAARQTANAARWAAFASLYRGHIEAEEGHAYPAARLLIGEPAQAAMGQEMAVRRGVR